MAGMRDGYKRACLGIYLLGIIPAGALPRAAIFTSGIFTLPYEAWRTAAYHHQLFALRQQAAPPCLRWQTLRAFGYHNDALAGNSA